MKTYLKPKPSPPERGNRGKNPMNIVVSIPAYNEEATIAAVIRKIKEVLGKHRNYVYRILVVDDGSADKTADVARSEGAVVHSHPKNYGLAETFRTEVQQFLK